MPLQFATASKSKARQILSRRFLYRRRIDAQISASQQAAFSAVEQLIQSREYELIYAPCPCGNGKSDVTVSDIDRYGLPLSFELCESCGTVRIDPYLAPQTLEHFYSHLYQQLYSRGLDHDAYFDRQRAYGHKLVKLFGNDQPRTILEVGCGAGGALSVFAEPESVVVGCDYSTSLIEYGRSRGISNLFLGSFQDIDPSLQHLRFDLILLHHVMEHVDSPVSMLQQISSLLSPFGKIVVIVPDLAHIHNHKIPNGDALKYFHIAHKYNFTLNAFRCIARQADLVCTKLDPPHGMPTAWSQASELWVQFSLAEEKDYSIPPIHSETGAEMLRYLLQTERKYRYTSIGLKARRLLKSLRPKRVHVHTNKF